MVGDECAVISSSAPASVGELVEVRVHHVGRADRRVVHHLGDLSALRRLEDRVGLVVGQVATRRHEPGDPPAPHGGPLLLGLVVGVGSDHVDAGDRVRLGELGRRPELAR